MISSITGKTVDVWLWSPLAEVESEALTQLRNTASLPWVFHHVAAMPDVHYGKGATVGSVVAMKGAVCPAAVGVDIGCGMGAVRTSLTASDLPDDLAPLRSAIEASVPVGFAGHADSDTGSSCMPTESKKLWEEFKNLHPQVQELYGKARCQLGTLGGGNHFIELCLDEEDRVWVMLHSGSRNIGKVLAEIHMRIASKLSHNVRIPDRDLSVFLAGTSEMDAYRRDLYWAQMYALVNRQAMMSIVLRVLRETIPAAMRARFSDPITCHHNYVAEEQHYGEHVMVTRKGAIRAGAGEYGIIPGSMGTGSYIVRGLGNPESFESASHGAGRRMGRGKAKRTFTLDDLAEQTRGVECRKDDGVLDEIPGAYKDIESVMANQRDLVEIMHKLKQVLCIKG